MEIHISINNRVFAVFEGIPADGWGCSLVFDEREYKELKGSGSAMAIDGIELSQNKNNKFNMIDMYFPLLLYHL